MFSTREYISEVSPSWLSDIIFTQSIHRHTNRRSLMSKFNKHHVAKRFPFSDANR